MLEVNPLSAQDWSLLKSVRLKALADAPEAFCTTLIQAQSWPDEEWQARAVRFATGTHEMAWIAYFHDAPCGMTTCYLLENVPIPTSSLAAVWVDPKFRRQGVGEALIDAAVRWSESRSVERVEARVTEHNGKAIAFYERVGFVRQQSVFESDASDQEVFLVRDLRTRRGTV